MNMLHPMLEGPVAIVDVQYTETNAHAACVVAEHWGDDEPCERQELDVPNVGPYVSGEFWKRELSPVLCVLARVTHEFRVIVIDGYVILDAAGTFGLGGHVHRHFAGRYGVVGVAKMAYRGGEFATMVRRGESVRPLFVTSLGLAQALAADLVRGMHGPHRIPTLLRLADQLARGTT